MIQGILGLFRNLQDLLDITRIFDFLGPLAFRLFLAPIFIAAGLHKMLNFEDMVSWFGNTDWGLGLPMPELMVYLATSAELGGGFALLFGFAVRWVSIPLMMTMIVAAVSVHWEHGWFAIASGNPDTSIAKVLEPIGFPGAKESLENSLQVGDRVSAAKGILREHGNYDWLTASGNFVVLNNGIEFAATYFIMLLSLLFTGAGSYFSVDYWIAKHFREADTY